MRVDHSCGHSYDWELTGEAKRNADTGFPFAELMGGYACPSCGGETGVTTYQGKPVPRPKPDEAVTFPGVGTATPIPSE